MRTSALYLSLLLSLCHGATAQQPADDPRAAAAAQANAAGDRMRHAEELLEQGDYKSAEAALKQIVETAPRDARIQYDLGFTEEHNGEDEPAAKAYAASIAADATLPEPRLALGLMEARQGQADAAHQQLEVAAKNEAAAPKLRARALRALARLDEAQQPEQARDELLLAAQLTGEQPGDTDLGASLAARAGDNPDAEIAYRRALAATPGDVNATVGLAALLQQEGKLSEADALLSPAVAAHPDDPQLAAQAAVIYAAEDKSADAIALLQHLRTTDPRSAADPALTQLLAHLELVSGDPAAAEPLYRTLVAGEPANPLLLDDLGSTLVRQNRFAEAQPILEKAVGMRAVFHDDSAWGDAEGHLAFAASRNHQPQVALQALAARATVLPNSPASLFLAATSQDALHQYKQAAESYRSFLAMANGKLPDEEFEARHRLVALEHEH